MKLIDVHRQFNTQDKCLDYLVAMRWPNGVCCIACGSVKVSKITREKAGKNKQTRIFQCLEKECRHQFSATTGTIFHDSHLPLEKWFMAIALICEAKKSLSANQMSRHLGVNYRTAWHLCHRIREAMVDDSGQLTGSVEVDETYVGARVIRKADRMKPRKDKDIVLGMVERGGKLRLVHIPDVKTTILRPVLNKHISRDASAVLTDEHPAYLFALSGRFTGKHRTINHSKTYGIGEIHTNTIENVFSNFKRGIKGSFHHVSIKHLHRYCEEFSYRFNRREQQALMFGDTLRRMVAGNALTYKSLTASTGEESSGRVC